MIGFERNHEDIISVTYDEIEDSMRLSADYYFNIRKVLFLLIYFLWGSDFNTACAKKVVGVGENSQYTIVTWNLGHFSKGEKAYSTIDESKYNSSYNELQRVLRDSIHADIVCLNEYSEEFGTDGSRHKRLTKELFFSSYTYSEIGPLLGFSCNSIFSNLKVKDTRLRLFEISKTVAEKMTRAKNYYYLESDIYLNNIKVKLVCTHTTNGAYALCQSQISELLNRYRKCERVIMCGDWNTEDFSLFKNSGYDLGNDGSLKTYPPKYALDNIAVKGLEITEVKMVKTDLSDHYPLVCRISLK